MKHGLKSLHAHSSRHPKKCSSPNNYAAVAHLFIPNPLLLRERLPRFDRLRCRSNLGVPSPEVGRGWGTRRWKSGRCLECPPQTATPTLVPTYWKIYCLSRLCYRSYKFIYRSTSSLVLQYINLYFNK